MRKISKPVLVGGGLVVAALIGWLAFGFFGIQAAFIDNEVSEAGPAFDSGAAVDAADSETEPETQTTEATTEENGEADPASDESEATEEESAAGEVLTVAAGDFSSLSRYTVTGQASVLNDGTEQRFLRFEGFESTNGPDLNVYLRAENGEFVDLGDLKGNIGDQNYEIPPEVDLETFSKVEIWCVRFGLVSAKQPWLKPDKATAINVGYYRTKHTKCYAPRCKPSATSDKRGPNLGALKLLLRSLMTRQRCPS